VTVIDTRGGPARTAGSLVRRPDRPGLGLGPLLLLAVAICGMGVAWASVQGVSTDRPTPIGFVVAAVITALAGRRTVLRGMLVALPLLWVGVALAAGIIQVKQQSGALGLTNVGTAFGSVTILEAPWLYLGVVLAIVIAAARRGLVGR
jgi:hypothetical protein